MISPQAIWPLLLVVGFFAVAIPLGVLVCWLLDRAFPRTAPHYCGSVWCERGCEGFCLIETPKCLRCSKQNAQVHDGVCGNCADDIRQAAYSDHYVVTDGE